MGRSTNSSAQVIDMGKFSGLRIIEIAALTFPESMVQIATSPVFSEIDKEYFSDSLIQSLKKSDVRVLPSAQTKLHIHFTHLVMQQGTKGTFIIMVADVAVSRNGIITRKTIEVNGKDKFTVDATKNNGIKMFIQELGELLREQSSFKR